MARDGRDCKARRKRASPDLGNGERSLYPDDHPWLRSYPQDIPATIDLQRYPNVPAIIEESFRRRPNDIAYSCMGRELPYHELESQSNALAAYFQKIGLVQGDRVAVMLPNILQSPITVIAVLRAGLVVVNVNPLYTPRELKLQLSDSGAKAIVILNTAAARLQEILHETDVEHVIVTGLGVGCGVGINADHRGA